MGELPSLLRQIRKNEISNIINNTKTKNNHVINMFITFCKFNKLNILSLCFLSTLVIILFVRYKRKKKLINC